MLKILILGTLGTVFVALGVLGIIIPILPGFVFLLAAAACFALISPSLRRRLSRYPRMADFFRTLDRAEHLNMADTIKLTFWSILRALNPKRRPMG